MTMLEDSQSWDLAVMARPKFANLPENFLIYSFEWLGDIDSNNCVMKVTGAVFREAKSGPRKGKLVIKVNGTDQMVFLTPQEIEAFDAAKKPARKAVLVTNGDDWVGLYIDGVMVEQGHSVSSERLMGVTDYQTVDVDQDWADSVGHYPELYADIPAEAFYDPRSND